MFRGLVRKAWARRLVEFRRTPARAFSVRRPRGKKPPGVGAARTRGRTGKLVEEEEEDGGMGADGQTNESGRETLRLV